MRFRHALGVALAALGGLAAGSGLAQSDTKTFDLSVSGVRVGTVTLAAEQSGDAYVATSRIAPSTLVGAFTKYAFEGRATGRVDAAGKVTPERFTADSTSPRAVRRTEIDWDGDRPVRVSVEPPRSNPADPSNVEGALDPVSAGFALLRDSDPAGICDASVELYDGSRRSRLSLGKPAAVDAGFACSGVYARLEGEAHTLSAKSEYPFTVIYAPNGDGRLRLERIETSTRFGPAVIARRG